MSCLKITYCVVVRVCLELGLGGVNQDETVVSSTGRIQTSAANNFKSLEEVLSCYAHSLYFSSADDWHSFGEICEAFHLDADIFFGHVAEEL